MNPAGNERAAGGGSVRFEVQVVCAPKDWPAINRGGPLFNGSAAGQREIRFKYEYDTPVSVRDVAMRTRDTLDGALPSPEELVVILAENSSADGRVSQIDRILRKSLGRRPAILDGRRGRPRRT